MVRTNKLEEVGLGPLLALSRLNSGFLIRLNEAMSYSSVLGRYNNTSLPWYRKIKLGYPGLMCHKLAVSSARPHCAYPNMHEKPALLQIEVPPSLSPISVVCRHRLK